MSESSACNRKHPPDRPPADQEGDISSPIGSAGDGGHSPSSQEQQSTEGVGLTRGKVQKTDGGFSGDIAMPAREEPWMVDSEPSQEPPKRKPMTYSEAVKPGSGTYEDDGNDWLEDDWDGGLITSNIEDMTRGVTISNDDQGVCINFSDVEKRRLTKKWQTTLIIKLLGGSLGYMHLKRRLHSLWQIKGRMELSCIGNGYLLASLYSKEDYYFALEGGPWIIQNHYLTVQTWKSNFNPWSEQIRKVAIWVRLPGLPVDYYDRKFFYNLGNMIGKAIKVDDMTLMKARTLYARMCVEIDLGTPLLPSYSVDGNPLKIEYEGLHLICFHCGRFGHNQEGCPLRKKHEELAGKEKLEKEKQEMVVEPLNQDGGRPPDKFGEWMVVKDLKRGKKGTSHGGKFGQGPKRGEKSEKGSVGSSRYDVLGTEETETDIGTEVITQREPLQNISNREVQGAVSGAQRRKSNKKGEGQKGKAEGRRQESMKGKDLAVTEVQGITEGPRKRSDKIVGNIGADSGLGLGAQRRTQTGESARPIETTQKGERAHTGPEGVAEALGVKGVSALASPPPPASGGEDIMLIEEDKPPDVASETQHMETEDVERFLGLEGENLSARQDTPEAVSTATHGSV